MYLRLFLVISVNKDIIENHFFGTKLAKSFLFQHESNKNS